LTGTLSVFAGSTTAFMPAMTIIKRRGFIRNFRWKMDKNKNKFK